MEKKTIGQFISALRRVNGMTQRELADRLNVSDKAVSRWERDESAPDLTLIPVIADLFGITSDELLRGERSAKTADDAEADPGEGKRERAKSERQIAFLLRSAEVRFGNFTLIPLAVDLLGLVAAMLCNFAFNRSLLGFFLHAAFFIAAVILRRVFLSQGLMAVTAPDLECKEQNRTKRKMIRRYLLFTGIGTVLFAFSLPLALFGGAFWGLVFSGLLSYGLLCAALTALLCIIAGSIADAALIRHRTYTQTGKEWYRILNRTFWKSVGIAAGITLCFFALYLAAGSIFFALCSTDDFVKGTEFTDAESFIAYMELPRHYEFNGEKYIVIEEIAPYSDDSGSPYHPEDPFNEWKIDEETTITFHHRNQTVCGYGVRKDKNGGLTFRTYTSDDIRRGDSIMNGIGIGTAVLLLVADVCTTRAVLKKSKARQKHLSTENS